MKTRQIPIEECKIRTEYQRDRDRIIHSKAFRRLSHKTQVFIAPTGDHYRTRMTHTLEVSQIARTIARACKLDEDLTEAIALGHDLGHTPFGHAGEEALNKACSFKFSHNEQSLRVVTTLENDGKGLNLCFATRDGIINHKGGLKAKTQEGLLVNISDRIAYVNHDIDDAIRANVLKKEDLPQKSIEILGNTHTERINNLVLGMINHYEQTSEIGLDLCMKDALDKLRGFMFENVYHSKKSLDEALRVEKMIEVLFEYFLKNPDKIPKEYKEENLERNVCDYIASMTDRYAINIYKKIFIPRSFSVN